MAYTTQTQSATITRTAVAVALAVVVVTVVGTTIGLSQWQQTNKGGLTVDDLDSISTSTSDFTKLTDDEGEEFGGTVANVGDLNGDGHDELVIADVGYWVEDAGEYQQGKIFGYNGNETAISTTADWTIQASSGFRYADFGQSVAGAGDVNGDGYDDLIVGAPADGEYAEGVVYGYYGSASGVDTTTASWTANTTDVDEGVFGEFGYVVTGLGDLNNDGYDDVAVYDGEANDAREPGMSQVSVYLGSSTGLATTASWHYDSNGDLADLGEHAIWLAGADVNGDAYADLIFGNPEDGEYGSVSAFYGSASGLRLRPDFRMAARTKGLSMYGWSTANAGDVNNDGYDDVIVGAPGADHDEDYEGTAVVYYGSSTGLSTLRKWQVESNMEDAELGYAVTSALDANGDGYGDIIVAAPGYYQETLHDYETESTGRVWIYAGSATGMVKRPLGIAGTFPEDVAEQVRGYGSAVASSETLVGSDGLDVIVAIDSWEDSETYGPAVLVYPNISL